MNDKKEYNKFTEYLIRSGFECGEAAVKDIVFDLTLRTLCENNCCGNYGTCHTCPPLCGEPDELINKIKKYSLMTVVKTVYPLEDSFDFEGMSAGQLDFSKRFISAAETAAAVFTDVMCLSAGGCRICEKCAAKENLPCRHPDKAFPSLEACCINVSDLAGLCGMKYIAGVNTVTYFGGFLI